MRLPVGGIVGIASDVLQIEDAEGIGQFIPRGGFTEGDVFHNQPAFLQGCEILCQGSSGREPAALDQFIACETDALRGESGHDAL